MTPGECPLCSAVTCRRPLPIAPWVVDAQQYVQCQHCGLVFIESPLPQSDDRPKSLETYLRYTNWKLPTNRERVNWLTRYVPIRQGRAVDIGTKDGSAVKVLAEMGWQASGYDPDRRFHGFAKQVYGIQIRPEWFAAEAVGPGSLSLVTAYHVLEHIPKPQPWLTEIRDALQPHGYLHIETPNLRLIDARQLHRGHVILYTRHTLRQMLEKVGFLVLVISEFGPDGNRTYDELAVVAQRDRPKAVHFSPSRVDRAADRYLSRAAPDILASPHFPVRLYRRVTRRIRNTFRRAGHRVFH